MVQNLCCECLKTFIKCLRIFIKCLKTFIKCLKTIFVILHFGGIFVIFTFWWNIYKFYMETKLRHEIADEGWNTPWCCSIWRLRELISRICLLLWLKSLEAQVIHHFQTTDVTNKSHFTCIQGDLFGFAISDAPQQKLCCFFGSSTDETRFKSQWSFQV